MSEVPEDTILSPLYIGIATRAANEGIPVSVIGRVLAQPFERVLATLNKALSLGDITQVPRPDWPPENTWGTRHPSCPRAAQAKDVEFACRTYFMLTPLEAAVMMTLLRSECADKDKLHGVAEAQRFSRAQRPNNPEETDPKIVDVVICKLRKKLKAKDVRFVLTTAWGRGYYFAAPIKELIYAALGSLHPSAKVPAG